MKINRIIYQELANEIGKPFISILIGPRQVGKTFIMRQLEEDCRQNGLKAQFHNLEDPDDLRFFSGDEEQLIKQLKNTDAEAPFAIVFSNDGLGEVECCGRPVRFLEWQEAEEIEYLLSVE